MTTLRFETITDLNEAKKWWEIFSPNASVYDLWEFRYCFHKYYTYDLRFYIGYDGDTPIGLLPLQYNKDKGYVEFFGTYFMETNQVFIKPGYENTARQFYEHITEKVHLESLNEQDEFTKQLPLFDYKYILDTTQFSSFEDYITKSFSSKSRSNLKKKIRQIEDGNTMEVQVNQLDDIELMFDFNIKTFDEKFAEKGGRRSSFLYPFRKEIYRDFLALTKTKPHVLTFSINGKKQAVSLTILYNGWYVFLNTGANIEEIPNMGNYTYYKNIEEAFTLGAQTFDAGVEAYGWKERFHLYRIPQHLYSYGE